MIHRKRCGTIVGIANIFVGSILLAVGCSSSQTDSSNGGNGQAGPSTTNPGNPGVPGDTKNPNAGNIGADQSLNALSVHKVSDLPACTDAIGGKVAYVRDEKAIYACVDGSWQQVDLKPGPAGAKGDKGDTGPQGTSGLPGPAGDAGPSGPQGPPGPAGDAGPQGPKGDTGAKGDKGDKGDQGNAGTPGAISRIKITTEPPGVNCQNGGIRVDAGIDANNNGILDAAEISATGYVCHDAPPLCGNGSINGAEQCDDNNTNKCDGCEDCQNRRWARLPANAYMTVASLAPVLQSGSLCVELWAKIDGTVADSVLASSFTSGTSGVFILRCQKIGGNNRLALAFQNATGIVEASVSANCNDNTWHHFAGCRDVQGANVNLTVFMDGTPMANVTGPTSRLGTAAAFYVGGVPYGQDGVGGYVDEIRISSGVRYATSFTPARRFSVDANTIALYHLDETSGSTAIDAVGSNNGTLGGAFTRANDTGYLTSMCQ